MKNEDVKFDMLLIQRSLNTVRGLVQKIEGVIDNVYRQIGLSEEKEEEDEDVL